ncbi:UxaA family hydrolase [Fodinicurvata halophila]
MTHADADVAEAEQQADAQTVTTTPAVVRLNPDDNVLVAARRVTAGTELPSVGLKCRDDIPAGHKVAARAVAEGEAVRKYGQIIGFATQDIAEGQHVHSHNCGMGDFERDYDHGVEARPTEYVPEPQRATFQGIVRPDGQVATRNYIGVLTTVNCSATVARAVASAFNDAALEAYPNVDGVVAFAHGTGCGMAGSGEGMELLQRTLHGYMMHPNFAGVLLIGLGCEMNQISRIVERFGLERGNSFDYMKIQEAGARAPRSRTVWNV